MKRSADSASLNSEGPSVLIIGAGLGGLASALMLKRQGIAVKVFERAPQPGEVGAGINITPAGAKVLCDLGLEDSLAAASGGDGIQTRELRYYTSQGALIMADKKGREGGYDAPQFSIHRGKLWKVLYEAAIDRIGKENVFTDHEFTHFTTGDDENANVTAHFTTYNGPWAGEMRTGTPLPSHSATVLIGCDGIKSKVRHQVYPNETATFTGWRIYRGVISPLPAQLLDGKTMVILGEGTGDICMYPMSEKVRQDSAGKQMQLNVAFVAYEDPSSGTGDLKNAKVTDWQQCVFISLLTLILFHEHMNVP